MPQARRVVSAQPAVGAQPAASARPTVSAQPAVGTQPAVGAWPQTTWAAQSKRRLAPEVEAQDVRLCFLDCVGGSAQAMRTSGHNRDCLNGCMRIRRKGRLELSLCKSPRSSPSAGSTSKPRSLKDPLPRTEASVAADWNVAVVGEIAWGRVPS